MKFSLKLSLPFISVIASALEINNIYNNAAVAIYKEKIKSKNSLFSEYEIQRLQNRNNFYLYFLGGIIGGIIPKTSLSIIVINRIIDEFEHLKN